MIILLSLVTAVFVSGCASVMGSRTALSHIPTIEETYTSRHEAGHWEVRNFFGLSSEKVTIVPRSDFLGAIWVAPPRMATVADVQKEICYLAGGAAGEQVSFGKVAEWGTEKDRKNATELVKRAQTVWPDFKFSFEDGQKCAERILGQNGPTFERLARGLLKAKTLSGEQLLAVVAGKKPGDRDFPMPSPSPFDEVVGVRSFRM